VGGQRHVWREAFTQERQQSAPHRSTRRCIARLRAHKAWIRERQVASGRTWNGDDLVFPAYTAIVAACARKRGLRTGLHNRRHARATLLLEHAVPTSVVAARLGHADATMTKHVYQHITQQAAQPAVAAPDRSLAKRVTSVNRPRTRQQQRNRVCGIRCSLGGRCEG
jgi:integrase